MDLTHFLLPSTHNSSFQAKLRESLKVIIDDEILARLKGLHYDVPVDLLIITFTSVTLSIAEYSYQSKEPIDIEALPEFIFKVMLQGPVKTLGLLNNN